MGLHKILAEFLKRPEFARAGKDNIITLRIFQIIEFNEKLKKDFYNLPAAKDTLHSHLPQVIGKEYKLSRGAKSTDLPLIREYTSLVDSFHFLHS